ncbi:MAG: Lrp/AsnC ligand binding domain-containing protein [Candidatus Thermoplasmatota archaeon]|nr:Lrp/AsnC ligand binding domain-containing protein [Candidatus Thermoplasmatota archaeon]
MKIRRKYLFYVLAFTAAIISAFNSGIDATVSSLFVQDGWALAFATFAVGIPVTLVLSLVFSIPLKGRSFGSRIADPSFKRLRLLRREEVFPQTMAALGNALYTVGYFALFVLIEDPSVVLPFTQVVILYLVTIEAINDKDMPTLSEIQSILIVTFGAILGSLSLSGSLNLESLLIVFFVINPGWVLLTIYQRKLKWTKIDGQYNDSINIRFWNVLFSCVMTAFLIFVYDRTMGSNHLAAGVAASVTQFWWIALISFGAFFAFVFYIRALGIGKASVVQAVRSSTIMFSIPISLFIASLGIIEPFSFDPVLLTIKAIGIIIMMLGIVSFALNLVKAYIFIRVKPGYPLDETMQKLWNIRGVTRVTATAGKYDFIVKIRIRALVKGYEKIIRRVEDIKAIDSYKWESVLKEWEDI